MIKTLVVGDIVGKPGRQCLESHLSRIRDQIEPDIFIVNAENAAGGFGLTEKVYQFLIDKIGVDCVTMGNHWHDKREIYDFLPRADKIVLPANMDNVDDEMKGMKVLKTKSGEEYIVMNFIGQVFMNPNYRPLFKAVDLVMDRLPAHIPIRFVDFHAEATSEKQGMGHYLAGRVSGVWGTHSHVQTADQRILAGHTGYITDVGMTGAYDSIIGMDKEAALARLQNPQVRRRLQPAKNDPWLCCLVLEIDENSGACTRIQRHRWDGSTMDVSG